MPIQRNYVRHILLLLLLPVIIILHCNRVLKCDIIKIKFLKYGICQDILKEQCPRDVMSISGQIVYEMLAGYTQTNPSNIFWADPKKL